MTVQRREIRLITLYTGRHPGRNLALPEEWTEKALCAEVDPEWFFPSTGANTASPKAICAKCDVREQCLDYALRHESETTFGIWGGLSARERRRLSKALNNEGIQP